MHTKFIFYWCILILKYNFIHTHYKHTIFAFTFIHTNSCKHILYSLSYTQMYEYQFNRYAFYFQIFIFSFMHTDFIISKLHTWVFYVQLQIKVILNFTLYNCNDIFINSILHVSHGNTFLVSHRQGGSIKSLNMCRGIGNNVIYNMCLGYCGWPIMHVWAQ